MIPAPRKQFVDIGGLPVYGVTDRHWEVADSVSAIEAWHAPCEEPAREVRIATGRPVPAFSLLHCKVAI
jgi:hypothetical protein